MVFNALAVLAACHAAGANIAKAAEGLGAFAPQGGRGACHEVAVSGGTLLLIDESYNANPASMEAAIAAMASVSREKFPRRVAVLGDMLELGEHARTLHEGLVKAIATARIDLVFAAGPMMRHLYDALPDGCRGAWAEKSAGLEVVLDERLAPGDVVMVKGSNGSRMAPLVDLVRSLGAKAA
jgi:UDP-N-acetylmuramoyl-tripeptide--D-alanyl-D-alanine ligase